MKTHVYYHGNCPDGFTAAWVAHLAYPAAIFTPVHYGQDIKPPADPGVVYFLDFCPSLDVLQAFSAAANSMIVLDHHKTQKPILDAWGGTFVYDVDRSGAAIAWDWFIQSPYPLIVAYAQDRDLWRHKLQYSREVSAYMMSHDYKFSVWDEIDTDLKTEFMRCVGDGVAIERYKQKDTSIIVAQTTHEIIGGHVVPVTNATTLWSEVGERMLKDNPDSPFVASFSDTKHGTRVWSLRSRQGEGSFDVSQIAVLYGGGGHRNAAGFRTPRPRALDEKGA